MIVKHGVHRHSLLLSISRVVAVVARRVMEDFLLRIIRESNNARLQNLRKSAQEAYGECIILSILISFFIEYFLHESCSYSSLLHFGGIKQTCNSHISRDEINCIYIYI